MRYIDKKERDKYGCPDCFDKRRGRNGIKCPHEDCPYKAELEKYKNYMEFLEKTQFNIGAIVKASGGKKDGNNRKRVIAVESGLVFETMLAAAKHFELPYVRLHDVMDMPHLTAGGQHWISVKNE